MLVKALETCFVEGSRRKAGAVFDYSGELTPLLEAVEGETVTVEKVEAPELNRRELMQALSIAGIKFAVTDNKEKMAALLAEAKAKAAPAATQVPSKDFSG